MNSPKLSKLHHAFWLSTFSIFCPSEAPSPDAGCTPAKFAITIGIENSEPAKITGITPAVFTLSGICDVCPPTSFLPCVFLEYCTLILLSPSESITINTTIPTNTAIIIIAPSSPFVTVLAPDTNFS